MKKVFSLILALLLCLSLCACTASNEDPSSPSTDPTYETEATSDPEDFSDVTISIVHSYASNKEDDLWIYKQIEEKFGCKVEVIEVYWALDNYAEKMSELMAEGNLPTIFDTFLPMEQVIEYGEQGKFVDVMAPENLEKMPNFAKLIAEDQDFHDAYMQTAAQDGSHYILPTYQLPYDYSVFSWVYNEVAFEKAGVEWRGDPEGFLQMLRDLKAYYPDSWPLTGSNFNSALNRICCAYNINSSYAAYDWDNGTWYYGVTADAYYDMLCLFQTAYNEELMHPSIMGVRSAPTFDYDIYFDRGFVYNHWVGWMSNQNYVIENSNFIDYEPDAHVIPAPTPVGPNALTPKIVKFRNITGTIINNQDPKAARCAMAIMDWMYDTSEGGGAWLNTVGPEEALHTDENGNYNWNEVTLPQGVPNLQEYVKDTYGMFQPALTVRYCKESPAINPEERAAEELLDGMEQLKAPPALSISDPVIERIYKGSQNEIKDMQTKFIIENWTREQFDAWLEAFNKSYRCVIEYLNA